MALEQAQPNTFERIVAEAAGRDRAQSAAHDEAKRAELRELPSEELIARREALHEAAAKESRVSRHRNEQRPMLELFQTRYENAVKNREAAEELGWRERRRELPRAVEREQRALEELRIREEVRDRWGLPGEEARRERQIAAQVLGEPAQPAVLAARLAPPDYIVSELGERPADPEKAKTWDRGVRGIETYRNLHGIEDTDSALGNWREGGRDSSERDRAQARIREAQRRLERTQQQDRSMQRSREMDHGLDLGIG